MLPEKLCHAEKIAPGTAARGNIAKCVAASDVADLVFIPRRFSNKPAMIVELKYGSTRSPQASADTAIDQIHRKEYKGKVLEYTDNLLLVAINYDKATKTHTCIIEKY